MWFNAILFLSRRNHCGDEGGAAFPADKIVELNRVFTELTSVHCSRFPEVREWFRQQPRPSGAPQRVPRVPVPKKTPCTLPQSRLPVFPKKIESKYPQISILPKTLRNKKIRTHSQKKREADRGNYLHEQSTLKWAEYNPAFSPGLQRRRTLPVALGVDATPCHWSICLLDSMCLRPFVLCYWTSSARRMVWSLLDCEYLNSS